MKKFLLISLLILSANAFSMNRIVNRATRVARIATVLRNQHLRRNLCEDTNSHIKTKESLENCKCKVSSVDRFSDRVQDFGFGAFLSVGSICIVMMLSCIK